MGVVDYHVRAFVRNRGVGDEAFCQSSSDSGRVSGLGPLGQRLSSVALLQVSDPDALNLLPDLADLIHGRPRNEVVETLLVEVDPALLLGPHECVQSIQVGIRSGGDVNCHHEADAKKIGSCFRDI